MASWSTDGRPGRVPGDRADPYGAPGRGTGHVSAGHYGQVLDAREKFGAMMWTPVLNTRTSPTPRYGCRASGPRPESPCALALIPFAAQYLLLRGFYASEDTRTPFFTAAGAAARVCTAALGDCAAFRCRASGDVRPDGPRSRTAPVVEHEVSRTVVVAR